jgi:hypothetical protein
VLTDLNADNLSFVRNGDNLLVKVTATGKTIFVEDFARTRAGSTRSASQTVPNGTAPRSSSTAYWTATPAVMASSIPPSTT